MTTARRGPKLAKHRKTRSASAEAFQRTSDGTAARTVSAPFLPSAIHSTPVLDSALGDKKHGLMALSAAYKIIKKIQC
jgi:hypothetical protein